MVREPGAGRVALVCPGQGSQQPGGVAQLPDSARAVFDRASALIGVDLWAAGLTASADELAMPGVLQPLLVAWAVADYERARAERPSLPQPDFVLGHSSGENSALVLAGAVAFDDAVRFAYQRGIHMDAACRHGRHGLLALADVDESHVRAIVETTGVSLANHNAVDQYVVGGSAEAMADAIKLAEEWGIQAVVLRVAGAFHTTFFNTADAAAEPLIDALPVQDPRIPLIGNRMGQLITDAAGVRAELRGQYTHPIRWVESLRTACDAGVRTFLVTGPGNAHAGLLRRFARTVPERLHVVRLNQPAGKPEDEAR